MRRPGRWVWGVVIVLLVVAAAEFAALAWLLPRYAVHLIRHHFGVGVRVGKASWQFPMTLVLSDVQLETEWPSVGASAKRVTLELLWVSWAEQRMWLRSVEIEQPLVRLSRTANGTFLWPYPAGAPSDDFLSGASAMGIVAVPSRLPGGKPHWALSVETLSVTEGAITFLDERLHPPYYGALDHISLAAGPMSWPARSQLMTVAVRGEFIGYQGHAAPVYCSGWLEPLARDMQTACQLEPLALAAFEPYYYQGRLQTRVYDAVMDSTSRWSAKADALDGRIQFTIKNLREGDLSVRGTTLVDIKRLTGGEPPTLTGEIQVAGPLSNPTQWHLELVPGNDIVQRLMKPLFERGREMIQFRVGKETIKLGIGAATADIMSGIREAGEEVQQSLDLLTTHEPPAEGATEAPAAPAATPLPQAAPVPPHHQPADAVPHAN